MKTLQFVSIKNFIFASALLVMCVLSFAVFAHKTFAFTSLTAQMSVGSRGTNVTNLQTFLAATPSIYPEGIISGYYGNLTRNAVMNFQGAYGIQQVGNVGPITLSKINSLIMGGSSGFDMTAPTISNASVMRSNNNATVSWNTDEATSGKVYYSTSPLMLTESSGAPIMTGGSVALGSSSSYSQSVPLNGLMSNTIYYYSAVSTDASGNVSLTWPQMFTTTQ